MEHLSKEYWDTRYKSGQTGWDTGHVTPPLKSYFEQLKDKSLHILIPGCGNAHEAAYLLQHGFQHVTCIDISSELCKRLSESLGSKGLQVICSDFFDHEGQYDLIVEQTFFCAIKPALRAEYAMHSSRLLKPGGKLVGLLFNCRFENDGPPFGGDAEEYTPYFKPYFSFDVFEPCINSIPQRSGNELFVILRRRS